MYWACAQLVPQRERLALYTLALAGYEAYSPRLRERRFVNGRPVLRTPPLFPNYLFVRIELQWHAARWAPGVARIVLDGAAPARVPDKVIAEIRSRERGGLVELPSRVKRGDAVRITAGPFREHLALFAEMTSNQRVAVLLQLFGSERRLELAADAIEPAP